MAWQTQMPMSGVFSVLCVAGADDAVVLDAVPDGPFDVSHCASLDEVADRLRAGLHDAVLIALPQPADPAPLLAWPALSHAVLDAAVVVVARALPIEDAVQLLQAGVQDVLADPAHSAHALRLAIERKRIERAARKAYATDLSTGLPNHAQLHEHMNHLLALREREPAPMALIVLRIAGLQQVAATLGAEAPNVLRRKAAVRLRAALRASDVVASVGTDAFAVLLAWIDSPHDGERVASKLAQSLASPYTVAGRTQMLAVSAGLASYPEHGKDADALLRRALGQASSAATFGTEGHANRVDRGPAAAANDDEG